MTPVGYHAHVYFDGPQSRARAMALRAAVQARFPTVRMGRVHDRPVAFHPAPMFQITMRPDAGADAILWLEAHRDGLSILIHPLTGDAWEEHTTLARWLGHELELDRARLKTAASAA